VRHTVDDGSGGAGEAVHQSLGLLWRISASWRNVRADVEAAEIGRHRLEHTLAGELPTREGDTPSMAAARETRRKPP
jgi:hypothetical protein